LGHNCNEKAVQHQSRGKKSRGLAKSKESERSRKKGGARRE
jgi:hypothetical protein